MNFRIGQDVVCIHDFSSPCRMAKLCRPDLDFPCPEINKVYRIEGKDHGDPCGVCGQSDVHMEGWPAYMVFCAAGFRPVTNISSLEEIARKVTLGGKVPVDA